MEREELGDDELRAEVPTDDEEDVHNSAHDEDSAEESDTEAAQDEDSDTEQTGQNSTDNWERNFGDHISQSLFFKAAAADSNEWDTTTSEDPELNTAIQYTLRDTEETTGSTKVKSWDDLKVKARLRDPFAKLNASVLDDTTTAEGNVPFTPLQQHLFPYLNNYNSLLFNTETHNNASVLRHLYALHALNHVYKTRDRVLKNTAKIKSDANAEFRDQGFTRPKVLILLPFRNMALEVVKMLISLSGTTQQDNKKRFFDEFGIDPEEDVVDPKKPKDHHRTFAGNIDDCFRVGIKFSRKQMKLFADFYSSDIIIASPLGLRMVIGAEGEKKRDFDFLSAIEMVILDRTDVFMMQNWDHVVHIFEHLNLIPKDAHGCDFSRVRAYYLDGR